MARRDRRKVPAAFRPAVAQQRPDISCPFCMLDPVRVVGEGPWALALLDGHPVSTGHTLVVPRRHFASLTDATPDELFDIWRLVAQARKRLSVELSPDGFNLGVNDGVAAGQTVLHLHVHLIPRFQGDVSDPRGGVRWVVPAKADYWSPKNG